MKLVIPKAGTAVTPPTATTTPALPSGPVTIAASASRTYTVKKGDTLYAIAKRYYNSGAQHKKLLRANRDQLRTAQDLKPGMVLDIPK